MKLTVALIALSIAGSAFSQSGPPSSGSAGSTISGRNGNNNDPAPIPTPQPGRTRPEWNPTPERTPSPTPSPIPAPRNEDRYERQPERQPERREERRDDRRNERRPERRSERDMDSIFVGDIVIYQGRTFEVLGGGNGTLEVRTTNSNYRYYIPAAAVARTEGCVNSRFERICVGDMTVGSNNIYYAVIGIDWNGGLVVQTTDWSKTIYGPIDPNALEVVR